MVLFDSINIIAKKIKRTSHGSAVHDCEHLNREKITLVQLLSLDMIQITFLQMVIVTIIDCVITRSVASSESFLILL